MSVYCVLWINENRIWNECLISSKCQLMSTKTVQSIVGSTNLAFPHGFYESIYILKIEDLVDHNITSNNDAVVNLHFVVLPFKCWSLALKGEISESNVRTSLEFCRHLHSSTESTPAHSSTHNFTHDFAVLLSCFTFTWEYYREITG